MKYPKFKVCVQCHTYNQSKYINDALIGFQIQKTNFPYVCCVIDDASTDGEPEVIKKYVEDNCDHSGKSVFFEKETNFANIIFARHNQNYECYFAIILLKQNLYREPEKKMTIISEWRDICEYDAFCEGDDFWIDSHKLQRQVDFLNTNLDCQLVFHNAVVRDEYNNTSDSFLANFRTGYFSTKDIYKNWQLPFASIVCRKNYYNSSVFDKLSNIWYGGLARMLAASRVGTVYGIAEVYSVYRKNQDGVSTTFSDAFCTDLNLSLARVSGSEETYRFAIKKEIINLSVMLPRLIFCDRRVLNYLSVVRKYDKYAIGKAAIISILTIPSTIIGRIAHYYVKNFYFSE